MASRGNTPGEAPSAKPVTATKEELLAEIDRLNHVIADQQDQINQLTVTAKAGKRGWIVSTPVPNYTGKVANVFFQDGHAFIPEEHPQAKKMLGTLTGDFGYSATFTENGQEVQAPAQAKPQSVFEAAALPHVI